MQKEKSVKAKQLEDVEAQIQMFEANAEVAQTKIKALQLTRAECQADMKERADAVAQQTQQLSCSMELHVQYLEEHQSVSKERPCSKSSTTPPTTPPQKSTPTTPPQKSTSTPSTPTIPSQEYSYYTTEEEEEGATKK